MSSRSGARIGSQIPTLVHRPDGVVGSSADECLQLAELAGLYLDPWQRELLVDSLSERRDGKWAAFEAAEITPRQNGKNAVVEARQLGGLYLFPHDRLQMHTAHQFKTSYEHFLRMCQLIEDTPDLDAKVKIIRTGTGDQAIELLNGRRLRFVTRSRKSGRGLSGDTVYLDEAMELSAAQVGALLPTMRARPNPQLWYLASAPMAHSTFLHGLLRRAERGDETRLFLAAWESPADTDFADVDAWYRCNPALGIRITEEQMRNELRTLGETEEGLAEFARELLGIREEPMTHSTTLEISAGEWLRVVDKQSTVRSGLVLAVDTAPESASGAIAVTGRRQDGAGHLEVIESKPGTYWIPSRLEGVIARSEGEVRAVGVDSSGPVQVLLPDLRKVCTAANVKLVELGARAYAAGCAELVGAVKDRKVWHLGQGWLDDAVASGRRRQYGKELWMWDRRVAADISPLCAVTVARRTLAELPVEELVPLFAFS